MEVGVDPVGGVTQRDQNDAGQEHVEKPDFAFFLIKGHPSRKRRCGAIQARSVKRIYSPDFPTPWFQTSSACVPQPTFGIHYGNPAVQVVERIHIALHNSKADRFTCKGLFQGQESLSGLQSLESGHRGRCDDRVGFTVQEFLNGLGLVIKLVRWALGINFWAAAAGVVPIRAARVTSGLLKSANDLKFPASSYWPR